MKDRRRLIPVLMLALFSVGVGLAEYSLRHGSGSPTGSGADGPGGGHPLLLIDRDHGDVQERRGLRRIVLTGAALEPSGWADRWTGVLERRFWESGDVEVEMFDRRSLSRDPSGWWRESQGSTPDILLIALPDEVVGWRPPPVSALARKLGDRFGAADPGAGLPGPADPRILLRWLEQVLENNPGGSVAVLRIPTPVSVDPASWAAVVEACRAAEAESKGCDALSPDGPALWLGQWLQPKGVDLLDPGPVLREWLSQGGALPEEASPQSQRRLADAVLTAAHTPRLRSLFDPQMLTKAKRRMGRARAVGERRAGVLWTPTLGGEDSGDPGPWRWETGIDVAADPLALGHQLREIQRAGFDHVVLPWPPEDEVRRRSLRAMHRAAPKEGLEVAWLVYPDADGSLEMPKDRGGTLRLCGKPIVYFARPRAVAGQAVGPEDNQPESTGGVGTKSIVDALFEIGLREESGNALRCDSEPRLIELDSRDGEGWADLPGEGDGIVLARSWNDYGAGDAIEPRPGLGHYLSFWTRWHLAAWQDGDRGWAVSDRAVEVAEGMHLSPAAESLEGFELGPDAAVFLELMPPGPYELLLHLDTSATCGVLTMEGAYDSWRLDLRGRRAVVLGPIGAGPRLLTAEFQTGPAVGCPAPVGATVGAVAAIDLLPLKTGTVALPKAKAPLGQWLGVDAEHLRWLGAYTPEHNGERLYRWMKGEDGAIEVLGLPESRKVNVKLSFLDGGALKQFTVGVMGGQARTVELGEIFELDFGSVPTTSDGRILLRTRSGTWRAGELNAGNKDPRPLGVAITGVQISAE